MVTPSRHHSQLDRPRIRFHQTGQCSPKKASQVLPSSPHLPQSDHACKLRISSRVGHKCSVSIDVKADQLRHDMRKRLIRNLLLFVFLSFKFLLFIDLGSRGSNIHPKFFHSIIFVVPAKGRHESSSAVVVSQPNLFVLEWDEPWWVAYYHSKPCPAE